MQTTDQSSGTDSAVNLWLALENSKDATNEGPVDSPSRRTDPLICSYSDYEDSVYGLAWSAREPWIFASFSYDERVVMESVKPHIFQKIMYCQVPGVSRSSSGGDVYHPRPKQIRFIPFIIFGSIVGINVQSCPLEDPNVFVPILISDNV